MSSDSFVLYGKDQSLAFILVNAGKTHSTEADPGAGEGSQATGTAYTGLLRAQDDSLLGYVH
jgi:hypothetical protein